MTYFEEGPLLIRDMEAPDIQAFAGAFFAQGWAASKPIELFARYYTESVADRRRVVVALWNGAVAGYVHVLPQAKAGPFAGKGLPEIVDFNVLKVYQRRGIGGRLLDVAESLAREWASSVTLGVGLYRDYGIAQRMYARRGYVPDGSGLWWRDRPSQPGETVINDDDLILYLEKPLS